MDKEIQEMQELFQRAKNAKDSFSKPRNGGNRTKRPTAYLDGKIYAYKEALRILKGER